MKIRFATKTFFNLENPKTVCTQNRVHGKKNYSETGTLKLLARIITVHIIFLFIDYNMQSPSYGNAENHKIRYSGREHKYCVSISVKFNIS